MQCYMATAMVIDWIFALGDTRGVILVYDGWRVLCVAELVEKLAKIY